VALGRMPLHFRYETGILHIACQHSRIISAVLLILSLFSVFFIAPVLVILENSFLLFWGLCILFPRVV